MISLLVCGLATGAMAAGAFYVLSKARRAAPTSSRSEHSASNEGAEKSPDENREMETAVRPDASGWRREGIAFVASTLGALGVGLWLNKGNALTETPALGALILSGALYVVASTRAALRLPIVLADAAVLGAAWLGARYFQMPLIDAPRLPFSSTQIPLQSLALPLTIFWVWAVSRMTAALNRTPQVTGGYLALVAFALLAMSIVRNASAGVLLPLACAALIGAGGVSVLRALKNPSFNLGWPAALAMGFLVAQISVAGLFKNLTLAMLILLLLVFGLPLLDVSFYRVNAARRGKDLDASRTTLRLHEVMEQGGIAPMKVALLYLAMAFYMTLVGVLFIVMTRWNLALRLAIVVVMAIFGIIAFFSLVRVLMKPSQIDEDPEDIEAFGMKISPVSMRQSLDRIENFIREKTPRHVVTSDANAILRAQEDAEYSEIVRRAALITPDGYGVMWGARLLNLPIYERVTGVDMVTGICERAAKSGYSIYILGSEPGIAEVAARNLQEKYPGLRVAGTHHGFWRKDGAEKGLSTAEADAQMADAVRAAAPDVLFVAMGIPMQEKFIAAHMERMNVPVSLGVGGSFDVYSGKYNRAPESIQRLGLEWIYRVWIDPVRWRRMGYVPRFMLLAIREWIFGPPAHRKPK